MAGGDLVAGRLDGPDGGPVHRGDRELQREGDADVEVHAPVAALLARKADHERAQLCVQAGERAALRRFLDRWMPMLRERPSRRVRWSLDVDPVSL